MQTSKNCENKTDEELVDLTLKDKDYFACIISRYEEKLLRYIKRITNMSNEEIYRALYSTNFELITNYYKQKNKKLVERKLEFQKYCKWCRKRTVHKESKK